MKEKAKELNREEEMILRKEKMQTREHKESF